MSDLTGEEQLSFRASNQFFICMRELRVHFPEVFHIIHATKVMSVLVLKLIVQSHTVLSVNDKSFFENI